VRARPIAIALALLVAAAGCDRQRQPVIPRAAWTERTEHRQAVEGADTTLVRITWPDFVGARRPESLDSLRAAVNALLVAPLEGHGRPAASPQAFMDGFIARWNTERQAVRHRAFWRLDRRTEVLAETLGVVSLVARDDFERGRDYSSLTVQLLNLDADRGVALGFSDLFREDLRDSLSAAIEPYFREARGIAPDSSLQAAGFTFEGDRFRVGDEFALTREGVWFHVEADATAHDALAATDFVVPFDRVMPFARPDGPFGRGRR